MKIQPPREEKYEQNGAVLTVGIDRAGRIYSSIEKNGKALQQDVYIRMPTEVRLAHEGWTRIK